MADPDDENVLELASQDSGVSNSTLGHIKILKSTNHSPLLLQACEFVFKSKCWF